MSEAFPEARGAGGAAAVVEDEVAAVVAAAVVEEVAPEKMPAGGALFVFNNISIRGGIKFDLPLVLKNSLFCTKSNHRHTLGMWLFIFIGGASAMYGYKAWYNIKSAKVILSNAKNVEDLKCASRFCTESSVASLLLHLVAVYSIH